MSQDLSHLLHQAAASAEGAVDAGRRAMWRMTGRHAPKYIAAYQGYADSEKVHVTGRVLAGEPVVSAEGDGWWQNFLQAWRRWESDEVPAAPVRLRFQEIKHRVVTDEEGYYEAEFDRRALRHSGLRWLTVNARVATPDGAVEAVHDIMAPPANAMFGIISDIDDTVIHTGLTQLLLAARLTFLENAKSRKPLEGVAKLYGALQNGKASQPLNPLFYLSNSPWNLYELLVDFMHLNEIPPGPLLLRDVGLNEMKRGSDHKQDRALRLIDGYPDLPFVLIGDSGQKDATTYASIAHARPGRIAAIYIRDVDPDFDSPRDHAVQRAIDEANQLGVPMLLVRDSLAISDHARAMGFIQPAAIEEVEEEVRADQARPEQPEQALREAVERLFESAE